MAVDAVLHEPEQVRSRSLRVGFLVGASVGLLGGLIGLGGAEFRLPLLIGLFGFMALQAIILNKAMSLIVVATALPARLLGVPFDDLVAEWGVIVNLLAGSLLGAWLGATWATRMASATLYRVIAALLVLIAFALAANHVGTVPSQDLSIGVQVVAGVAAGLVIGVVAALMGVAGGELLFRPSCCSMRLISSSQAAFRSPSRCPRCSSRSLATAGTAASSSCASIAALSSRWRRARSPEPLWAGCC